MEADLIVEHLDHLQLIEAKAGQTIYFDMLKPARRVKAAVEQVKPAQAVVVYGGDQQQRRSDVAVLGWEKVEEA